MSDPRADTDERARGPAAWLRPSWLYYLYAAALIAVAFGAAHAAGLRERAGALAGTETGGEAATAAGLLYLALYALALGLAPILVIAGGLWRVGAAVAGSVLSRASR